MTDTLQAPAGGDGVHPVKRLADISQTPKPALGEAPIAPERYWSKDFMQKEWDHVWTKTWQVAGVKAQIQKPGDYITFRLGYETILCVMGDDHQIRAFYNVCQHRGMLLMAEEQGNAKRLVCPYHGWAFNTRGVLKAVPDEADFPQGSPCGKKNLVEVPCETWAGFIWINMDPDCDSLRSFMSPVADMIDTYPMDDMVRTHWMTVEGNFNWKLIQDNFNESYHVPFVHPQLKFTLEYAYDQCQFDLYPSGHARMLMPGGEPAHSLQGGEEETLGRLSEQLRFWELDPDQFRGGKMAGMREALQRQKRLLGEKKGFDFSTYHDAQLTDNWHFTIFPNLSFSLKPDGNIWLRARPHETDPEKCYFDMWYMTLFPKGQETYFSQSMRQWVDVNVPAPHQYGKSGEIDLGQTINQDFAVWEVCQRGIRSRGYTRDYLPGQEDRVRFFHENLDRWMAR